MADLASTVIYGYLQVNDSITAPKLTLTQATGTAPMTITSTTLVSNLNVDYLDGQHGSYYLGAGNLTGTLSADRIASNSITLAKLETIPTATILGRNTTAVGNIEELSTATVKTMLNLTGTNSGDQNLFSHIHALNSSGTDVTNSPFNVTSSAEAITLKAGTNVTLAMDTSGVVTITSAYTNTATAADGIFDGTNTGTEIKYSPYSTQQTGILSFDTSATAPTRTDRLNLNGHFYATQLYEGSTRALVRKTSDTTVTTHKFALFDTSSGDIIRSPITFNDSGTTTSELISASQVNTRIDNAVTGIGARLLPPVADLTALKAVNTTTLTDKTMINCETLGLYRLDLQSSATADDNRIVAPTTGSGRWIKMSASINDHNNLTAIQGGATGDYQHLTTTQLGYIHASGSDNQNLFSTIAVSGQSNIVADTTSDTLTFVAGNNISLTTNAGTDSLTINSANPSNYGVCSTASATVAKTVTITNFALVTGVKVTVKFSNANTATNPTLNVNSTGAKALYDGTTNIKATLIEAGKIYDFVYDGTNYVLISGSGSVTTPISKTTSATVGQTEFTYTTGDGWTDDLLGLLVFRSGIYMTPTTDYSIDNVNKKITFESACEAGEIITVIFNNSGTVDAAYTPADASETVSGIVTTGNQTFAGAKTFTSNIIGNVTGNADTSSSSSSTSAIAGISTYTGTTDPTGTTRVNIDGYVYATKVYNAVFNDYAECFNNDKLVYRDVRNRIVELDDNGNTVLATENSTNVIGVVSDSYGHMLGGTEEDIICSNKLPIGLSGVLYVDAIEPVDIKNKGKFVVSAGDGYAKVDENPKLGTIVGKIIGIDELINRYKIIITLV